MPAGPLPPPSPPAAIATAAQVEEAASTLVSILGAQGDIDEDTAQVVTNLVSNLIGAQSDSLADITTLQGSPAESVAEDEASEAADAIARAVMQLAAAAAVGSGNELVELQSANLNLTTEAREPLELSARPVVCNTADEPVEVQMPASILQAAPGADALLPVSVVLYTTATSLHSTAGSIDGRTSSNRSLSQSVSFSLMQGGVELSISGAAQPINISVPYRPVLINADGEAPCVGTPANATAAALCPSTVECYFWNATLAEWSREGCTTLAGPEGGYTCSCDHLTEFVIFEFPRTVADLFATLPKFNGISERAVQCTLDPRRSWWTALVPACTLSLLIFFVGALGCACYRDEIELRNTLLLLEGRRKDLAAKETLRRRRRARRVPSAEASAGSLVARRRSLLGRAGRASATAGGEDPPGAAATTPRQVEVAPTAAVPAGASLTLVADAMRGMLTRKHLQRESRADGAAEESSAAAGIIQRRWKRARTVAHASLLAKRWHKDNDTFCKRLFLQCRRSHTLYFFETRGSSYTRAQMTMILVNSLAFELVMLCAFYEPTDGALVINVVGVVVSGTICALIVVPTMVARGSACVGACPSRIRDLGTACLVW